MFLTSFLNLSRFVFYNFLLVGFLFISSAYGDGELDHSFITASGVNGGVNIVILQPDGKVIIGGRFSNVHGVPRNRIARLNADGQIDSTFDPGTGANEDVNSIILLPDGKLLIGGRFSVFNNQAVGRIVRLNPNGTIDSTFNPGAGANAPVFPMALQSDGKIIVSGQFSSFNNVQRQVIARINPDGSLDHSFNAGSFDFTIAAIVQQPDGKILIGGYFTKISNSTRQRIARLNSDGSLDQSFNPSAGADGTVLEIVLQTDGKILIGGDFSIVNGISRPRIARLNADGTRDQSFDQAPANVQQVLAIALQPDGRILIGGNFQGLHSPESRDIARLNNNGSIDSTFDPGISGVENSVNDIALQSDGKFVIGGSFARVRGQDRYGIARMEANGFLDPAFNAPRGFNHIIRDTEILPDGKILVAGQFSLVDNYRRPSLVRLHPNGQLDLSFKEIQTNSFGVGICYDIEVLPDGKILAAGAFYYDGSPGINLVRFHSDGSLDTSFTPETTDSSIFSIAVQSNGKILIGGHFTSVGGVQRNRIARLNANGEIDLSFNPGEGADWSVRSVLIQPDEKILLGGYFATFNGVQRKGVSRLNSDGTLDATFDAGAIPASSVWKVIQQSDGKTLIGGSFNKLIARLNQNGSVDSTFNTGVNMTGNIQDILLARDGKIYLGGSYSFASNGVGVRHISRLNANGTPDMSFSTGLGPNSDVFSLSLQTDNRLIIAGGFSSVNNLSRNHIARLHSQMAPTAASVTVSGRVMTAHGKGIRNVLVRFVDDAGQIRTVLTSTFGYYKFADIPAGQTYTISVSAKKYTFAQPTQVLNLTGETSDVNFVADN